MALDKKTQEQIELGLLNALGEATITVTEHHRRHWWCKPVEIKRTLTIKPPTLAVLDLLSTYWLDFDVTAEEKDSVKALAIVKGLTAKHAMSMAKVVAVMALGEESFKPRTRGGYDVDERRINETAAAVAHALTPDELFKVTQMVTALSGLGAFVNSMRLMSASRTTQPRTDIE